MSDHWLIAGTSQVIKTSHSITTFRGILAQNRSQPFCFIRIKTHFPLLSYSTFHSALYSEGKPWILRGNPVQKYKIKWKTLEAEGTQVHLKKNTRHLETGRDAYIVTQTPPLSVLPSAGEQQWEFSNPKCLYRRTSCEHSWQVDPTPPPSGLVALCNNDQKCISPRTFHLLPQMLTKCGSSSNWLYCCKLY